MNSFKEIIQKNKYKKQNVGLLFILPCLLFLLIFVVYPLFNTIYLSFHQYNPLQSLDVIFVGLQNYKNLFVKGSDFLNSFYITVLYTVLSVICQGMLGLIIAILISNLKDGSKIKRLISVIITGIFIIPWAVPGISAYTTWRMLYHPIFGPINSLLGKDLPWLSDPFLALISIVIVDIWKMTPFFIIIFLAAIIAIPKERFESASIDGSNEWQKVRYMVLPSIIPAIAVASIFRAIDSFTKVFDAAYVLTGGGPGRATQVLPVLIVNTTLRFFKFGEASALSVVSILISLVIGIWLLRSRTK